jgi:hypothetical protein
MFCHRLLRYLKLIDVLVVWHVIRDLPGLLAE